jgi:acyl carrier protein
MDNKIEDKIINVMSAVFNINTVSIVDTTSSDNIESWDSLGHLQLVAALEEEFDIRFEEKELIDMITYSIIKMKVIDKITS